MFLRCSFTVALWVFINCTDERGMRTPMKYNNGKPDGNIKLLSTGQYFPASTRNDENIKLHSKANDGRDIRPETAEKGKGISKVTKKHSKMVKELPLIGNRYSDIWNKNGSLISPSRCREKLSNKNKENSSNFIGKVKLLLNKKRNSEVSREDNNNMKSPLLESDEDRSSSDTSDSEKPLIDRHGFTDISEKLSIDAHRFTDILEKPSIDAHRFTDILEKPSIDGHRFTDILYESEDNTNFPSEFNRESVSTLMEKTLSNGNRFTDILYEDEDENVQSPMGNRDFENTNRLKPLDRSRSYRRYDYSNNRFTDILFEDENEKSPLKNCSLENRNRMKSFDRSQYLFNYRNQNSDKRFTDTLRENENEKLPLNDRNLENRNRLKSFDRSQTLSISINDYSNNRNIKSPVNTRQMENENRLNYADTSQPVSYIRKRYLNNRLTENESKKSQLENRNNENNKRSNNPIDGHQSTLSCRNKYTGNSLGEASKEETKGKSPLNVIDREIKKLNFIRKSLSLSSKNFFNSNSPAPEINPKKRYNHILLDDDTSTVASSEYSRFGSKSGLKTYRRSQSLITSDSSSDRLLKQNFSDQKNNPSDLAKNEKPTLTSERFFDILNDIENVKSTRNPSGESSSHPNDKRSFLNILGVKKSKDPSPPEKDRILEILHDVEKLKMPAERGRKIRGSKREKDNKLAECDKRLKNIARNLSKNESSGTRLTEKSDESCDEKLSSVIRGMESVSFKNGRFLDALRQNENMKILLQNLTKANKDYYKQIGRQNVENKFKNLDDMIPSLQLNTLTQRTYVTLNNYHFPSEETLKHIRSFLSDKYYSEYMEGKALEDDDFENRNLKSICEEIKEKSGLLKDPYESELSSISTIKRGRVTRLINHQSGKRKSFLSYGVCNFESEIRIMIAYVNENKRYYFLGIYFGKGVVVIVDHFTESHNGKRVVRDYYAQ